MAIKKSILNKGITEFRKDVCRGNGSWLSFLDSAAYMYKYHFVNQMAIYTQRHDCEACTSMAQWNYLGRSVKKGSEGIRLAVKDRFGSSIYVFDARDTQDNVHPELGVQLWELPDGVMPIVSEYLEETFDLNEQLSFDEKIAEAVDSTVSDEYFAWVDELIEKYPELLEKQGISDDLDKLLTIMKKSVTYIVRKRCDLDVSEYSEADFQFSELKNEIFKEEMFLEIGTMMQRAGYGVLHGIEQQAKAYLVKQAAIEYNKEKENERERSRGDDRGHEVQEGGRLLSAGHRGTAAAGGGNRQVWEDERGISDGREASDVSGTGTEQRTETAPDGYQRGSRGDERNHYPEPEEKTEYHRRNEERRPIRLGKRDEHYHDGSRIHGSEHGSVQLNFLDELKGEANAASSFLLPEMAGPVLCNIRDEHKKRVCAAYKEGKTGEALMEILSKEYKGGRGLIYQGERYAAWTDTDGIWVAKGNSALVPEAECITWQVVETEIAALLFSGSYMGKDAYEAVDTFEREETAQYLYYLMQDISELAKERQLLSSIHAEFKERCYPPFVEHVSEMLKDKEIVNQFYGEVQEFVAALEQEPALLRFNFSLKNAVQSITNLTLPRKEFTVPQHKSSPAEIFITQDEFDWELLKSEDIVSRFLTEEFTKSEKANFLKKRLSLSGRTAEDKGWYNCDSKGATLKKGNCTPISMTWTQMAERYDLLIEKYYQEEELKEVEEELPSYLNLSIEFSEHPAFNGLGPDISFALGNRLIGYLDEKLQIAKASNPDQFLGYYKTYCKIDAMVDGEEFTFEERYDIGDGNGGLVSFVKSYYDYALSPNSPYLSQWKEQGEDYYNSQLEKLQWGRAVLVPYLEAHTELSPEEEAVFAEIVAGEDTWFSVAEERLPEKSGVIVSDEPEEPLNRRESLDAVEKMLQSEQQLKNEAQNSADNDLREDSNINSPQSAVVAETADFSITDYDLGKGTKSEKFRANVAAIRTLKTLDQEQRAATPEEQAVLSGYVGWGGLTEAFEPGSPQYDELKSLLTDEEYTAAADSVLNAHYTQPLVIEKMYDVLQNLGFSGGNILEPAAGSGNFFGMMPEALRGNSNLYGVELDSISGRIARRLYPSADIQIKGYEETGFQDNTFDVAIGNVPFGDYGVNDSRYNNRGFLIHDYFFAKTLDQVRPGGVIAFITSKGTLDKKNSSVRKYIAERAELLGAIRLPNTAFKENAGTEVTSDIIFLKKREALTVVNENENWLHLGTDENGVTYNQYFIENPNMVIGSMQEVSGRFGNENACILKDVSEFEERLNSAVRNIQGDISATRLFEEIGDTAATMPSDPDLPNYAYSIINGKLYYKENSVMRLSDLNLTAIERAKAMIAIRDCVKTLIDLQLEDGTDEEIKAQQVQLNSLYDDFSKKYGLISSRANSLAFREDSSYPLICSLENLDDDGNLQSKADIFTKRTVRKTETIDTVDTAAEALAVSLAEKGEVDLAYMQGLSGRSEEDLISELQGAIYRVPDIENPEEKHYVTADEYLSGNIRTKLSVAKLIAAQYPEFKENVSALEEVMPEHLTSAEIKVQLGSVWVPQDIYEEFMYDLLETPRYLRDRIRIEYNELTGEWGISSSNSDWGNTLADTTYGTQRANAYRLIKDSLNLRTVNITDTVTDADGRKRTVQNEKETALASQKQDEIKRKFMNWVWEDEERKERLENIYNVQFNSNVAREFNGSHLSFPGMNTAISLKPYQKDAVARQLYGGNTLLAHVVGAGKTYEIIAAIMEKKRLGLSHKAIIVVPNHLTDQWATEFMKLYPTAKVLATTKKDFEPENRKRFCSRIATGDYDAVIIGHSQYERIPLSKPRQRAFIQSQLDDVQTEIVALAAEREESFTIKQLKSMEKKLKVKLEKLNESSKKDNTITFEELGVDFLCVDEAHSYKNLAFQTKMSNVAGISTTGANKSYDMFAKCRYIDELTKGKGITFATGTPVSNSMSELYTMQKYLQYDELRELGIITFDAWASLYGETITQWELAPEGTKYRKRTRFARFHNLPELMSIFKNVADIKTRDMLDLDVPEGIVETVVIPATSVQTMYLREIGKRADLIRAAAVDPSVDNMLKITTDGRKLALDERIITGELTHPLGKTKADACVEKCMEIYRDSMAERSTQLIFCDQSTPKPDGQFSVYNEIRKGLMEAGVPREEIAFIHDYNTDAQKSALFSKMRKGKVRFILASTPKMGAGTNVQNKLKAIHHVDVPWRPADLEQQDGRGIRPGNDNDQVYLFRYVTENTFDAYSWQTLEIKQKFINQIMTSKNPARSCEDVDLSEMDFAVTKALCTNNPKIKEKMELENDVNQLRLIRTSYENERYHLKDRLLRSLPLELKRTGDTLESCRTDYDMYTSYQKEPLSVQVAGHTFTNAETAGAAIFEMTAKYKDSEDWTPIGTYKGFTIETKCNGRYYLRLCGAGTHGFERGPEPAAIIEKMEKQLKGLKYEYIEAKKELAEIEKNMEKTKIELEKPFEYAAELAEKEEKLLKITEELEKDKGEVSAEAEEYAYESDGHYLYLHTGTDGAEYSLYNDEMEVLFTDVLCLENDTPSIAAAKIFDYHGLRSEELKTTDPGWLKSKMQQTKNADVNMGYELE